MEDRGALKKTDNDRYIIQLTLIIYIMDDLRDKVIDLRDVGQDERKDMPKSR